MPTENNTPEVFKLEDAESVEVKEENKPSPEIVSIPEKKETKNHITDVSKLVVKVKTNGKTKKLSWPKKAKFIKIKKKDIKSGVKVTIDPKKMVPGSTSLVTPRGIEPKKTIERKSKKLPKVVPIKDQIASGLNEIINKKRKEYRGEKLPEVNLSKNSEIVITEVKEVSDHCFKEHSKNKEYCSVCGCSKSVHKILDSKHPGGRPSIYSQDLADAICEELALGTSLRTVCSMEGMPSVKTVFNWFRIHEEFLQQYTRAKQESADAMAEEILDISDDGTNDWMTITTKRGDEIEVLNKEALQRSRLRVETRKWLMSKMKPKVYGEKLDLSTGGNPLTNPYAGKSLEELKQIVEDMESEKEIRARK